MKKIYIDGNPVNEECAFNEIQNIKIAVNLLQNSVNQFNDTIDSIEARSIAMDRKIDSNYAVQTSTLLNAVGTSIEELKSSLESKVQTSVIDADSGIIQNTLTAAEVDAERVNADSVETTNLDAENIDSKNIEAESVVTENLTTGILKAENIETDSFTPFSITTPSMNVQNAQILSGVFNSLFTESAKVSSLVNQLHTVDNTSEWKTPNTPPDETQLLKMTIPAYDGVIVIPTRQKEFSLTIMNNSLVSYMQNNKLIIYRIETSNNDIVIYFSNVGNVFSYAPIYIGDSRRTPITTELVDRAEIESNISSLNGVYFDGPSGTGSGTTSAVIVDELPVKGNKGTIYIVKDDKSYYYDGSFVPMSIDVDITSGHITQGKLDENLIYPAVQYTVDYEVEAFPGTFYDVSLIESEQIPEGTKLLYVDENNKIKFSPEYLLSGTKFGKKENVEANKETFENIQWIKNSGKVSFNVPELSPTTWEIIAGNTLADYYVSYDGDPIGAEVNFTVNDENVTGIVEYDATQGGIGFSQMIKGVLNPDGTVAPDENGDLVQFAVIYIEDEKKFAAHIYSFNDIRKVGTVLSNSVSGEISTYSEDIPLLLEDFIYKTEALTITNESGKTFSVGSQKVQSFVDYKQNAINSILDERSAYNNLLLTQVETILSEDVDFNNVID